MPDFSELMARIEEIDKLSTAKCVRVNISSVWRESAFLYVFNNNIVAAELEGIDEDDETLLEEIACWSITDIKAFNFPKNAPTRIALPFSPWITDIITPLISLVTPTKVDINAGKIDAISLLDAETFLLAAFENFEVSVQQQGDTTSVQLLLQAMLHLINAFLDALSQLENQSVFEEILRRVRIHQPPLKLHGKRLHPDLAGDLARRDLNLVREQDIPVLLDLIHVVQPYNLKAIGFNDAQVSFLSMSSDALEKQVQGMVRKW